MEEDEGEYWCMCNGISSEIVTLTVNRKLATPSPILGKVAVW